MNAESSLAVLIILTIGNYWLKRSVLYPPFLFCSMWLLATALYASGIVETDPIDSRSWAIFTAGAVIFSASGVLALLFPEIWIETRIILTRFPRRNTLIKPLLILFLLCGLPLMIQSLRAEAAHGEGGTFLERARNGGITAQRNGETIEGLAPGFTIYFLQWAVFASVMFMLEGRDKSFWFVAALALLYSILSTGRTSILQLFAALVCVHLIQSHRTTFWGAVKVARFPILIFVALYVGLVFVNKSEQSQFYATSAAQIAVFFLVSYIVGPLAAFNVFINSPPSLDVVPNHTFKFFLTIIGNLHLIQYAPAPILQEFVGVPYPVNVYTMYKDYVIDFGIFGALLCVAVIGFVQVLLYRKALTGSLIGTYLFALSMFPTLMSIFTDQYSSLGVWTNSLIFAVLYVFFQSRSFRVLPRLSAGYGVPG